MANDNLVKVTILGTSDVHGFYQNFDYAMDQRTRRGGLSKVSTIFKELKKENPNTMLIDCGDLIQGNSAEVFLDRKKYPGIEAVNEIGYEIINMGNHEFNFGMEKLFGAIKRFKGITMMGNLYHKENDERVMRGFYQKKFGDINIGFISLNTPLVRHFEEKRGNLKDHNVTDADYELVKILKEIKDIKLDALIGIFHMGDKNENNIPNTGVRDLMYNVEGSDRIDAIFGGHMHQIIEKMMIKNTIFVQPGSRGEAVNRIDLVFDKSKEKTLVDIDSSVILIDEKTKSDLDIETVLMPYHIELRDYANEHIGYVEGGNLTPKDVVMGLPQTRIGPSKVADFFLDVMLYYSKADVVATHLDNPYPYMPGGQILRKHIYNSYSYAGGDISNYKIKGKDLKDYMEWSAGYLNQSKEGDLTISFDEQRAAFKYSTFDIFGNIKYKIDLTKPMGSRVKDLQKLDGTPITDDMDLILGLNKYRMDFLTSEEGPLHDRIFENTWSSMTEPSFEVRGTIRNLSMKYLQDLGSQSYIPKKGFTWEVLEYKVDPAVKAKAIQMLRDGVLELPKKRDGSLDLTKSKNLYDRITVQEISNILNAYPIYQGKLRDDMTVMDVIYEFNKVGSTVKG